ncbi:MAG TPA: glycosyltransferase family 1 protein [Chloroflexota bacterium]
MRVCLDASPAAQGRGGIGRYAARLAEALAALPGVELSLLYHGRPAARLTCPLDRLPARRVRVASKPWRASLALAYFLRLPLDRVVGPSDVFHATDHVLPPLRRTPSVFTVHDLAFLVHPETHLWSNRAYLQTMMPRYVAAATMVIADSEATRQDVLSYYRAAPDKVRVVPLGVEPAFSPVPPDRVRAEVAARHGLDGPYLLFVGTLEPRKNLVGLLRAYAALLGRRADTPALAIAGAAGWEYDETYRFVAREGLGAHVRFLGRVPDAALPALYGAATALAYPSLYEGFGLPPLEALACGTAVVCSNRSSLPEVVSDAALVVDPTDVGALATALERLLDDEALRRDLRARGLARARQFTWERTAAETLRVFEEAVRRGGRGAGAARRTARN